MIIRFLIFTLSSVLISCQLQDKCSSARVETFTHYQINQGFLDSGDSTFLYNIYDEPNGEVIYYLQPAEEAGWGVTIVEESGNYFKILNIWRQSAEALDFWKNDWMNEYKYVWIEKGSVGINTKNYDQQLIYLYSKPSTKSKSIGSLNNVQTVIVKDVCNDWANVIAQDHQGKDLEGWLSPKDQCSNPLSACN